VDGSAAQRVVNDAAAITRKRGGRLKGSLGKKTVAKNLEKAQNERERTAGTGLRTAFGTVFALTCSKASSSTVALQQACTSVVHHSPCLVLSFQIFLIFPMLTYTTMASTTTCMTPMMWRTLRLHEPVLRGCHHRRRVLVSRRLLPMLDERWCMLQPHPSRKGRGLPPR
jgi:hypothetical protein